MNEEIRWLIRHQIRQLHNDYTDEFLSALALEVDSDNIVDAYSEELIVRGSRQSELLKHMDEDEIMEHVLSNED